MKSNDRIKEILNIVKTKEALEIGRYNKKDFTRKSPLGFENLCNLLIFREGKTNQMEIYNFFNKIGRCDLAVTKSALTQQREKLNPEIFEYMNSEYVKKIYSQVKIKTILGTDFIPCGIDGSVIEIPNTETIRNEMGYIQYSQEIKKGTARAQVSGLYDSLNDIMIHSKITKYETSEKELAKQHIEYVQENLIEIKDRILYIFDRGYISTGLLLYLNSKDCKYIFRVNKTVYSKEIRQMNTKDEIITVKITKSRLNNIKEDERPAKLGQELKLRVVKVILDTGEEEILITNISKTEIPTEKMKEVYFLRWKIETSYDVIKNKLQIENFSGYSKKAIEQDFYAQILLFNMAEDIKREVNEEVKGKRKYEYIVNINILIGIAKYYLLLMSCTKDLDRQNELENIMLKFIKQNLVMVKSGRKNKRYKFGVRNKYKTIMKRSI